MNNLVFKPYVSAEVMSVLCLAMLFIVILSKKNIINRILIIILVFIISQRPMLEFPIEDDTTINGENYDVTFVVDRTISMNAIDMNGDTRLNAAKKDCNRIIDYFKDAYFTILIYDEFPDSVYPLTKETDIIKNIFADMDVVSPNYITNSPSLNVPKDELKNLLTSTKRHENLKQIVFFISDGEIKSDDSKDLDFSQYKEIADLIDGGAVLGYGTEKGEKIAIKQKLWLITAQESDYIDKNGYLKGSDGLAIAKYNENNLQNLASNIGLDYVHVTDSSLLKSELEKIVKDINAKEKIQYKDLDYYFSWLLLLLIFYELLYNRSLG